ncbi:S8 family peptidase [Caldalkalibacillus salinus]|uniref:S8 family peptidase n=1 Tax=Caldalkalibacillus salinus TaxID=2803787 RepID=UPI0019212970|nr:S8 family peptidase [Caldalkalibacillus salinus]
MKKDVARWIMAIAIIGLVFVPIWMGYQEQDIRRDDGQAQPDQRDRSPSIYQTNQQEKDQPTEGKIDTKTRDQVLTKDLSLTTSFFIGQLQSKLEKWAELDFTQTELVHEFEQELEEHPHFEGFAYINNQEVSLIKGDLDDQQLQAFLERLQRVTSNQTFSSPFTKGERQRMLMATQTENQNWVVGQVDLSFVKGFVGEMASVADANGHFFISSAGEKEVEWDSKDQKEGYVEQKVPELDWTIVMRTQENEKERTHYPDGEVIVQFNDVDAGETWLQRHPEFTLKKKSGVLMLIAHDNMGTEDMLNLLRDEEQVVQVEPNHTFIKQQSSVLPNDEFFEQYQWNLSLIQAELGWDYSNGSEEVPIAYLDTGIDTQHQDLAERVAEGFNAFDETDEVYDYHGHGTHVAGVIGAMTNNETGIAGVSWNNPIMPVKVLNDQGEGSLFEVASGIIWATDHGARVINLSLGDTESSQILRDAVRYAYENDVALIAAAGNDNVGQPMYPAGYEEVLAVAAVNQQNEKAVFSNYGEHIDVTAPGENIPSTFPDHQYVFMSGTSMAAPHVTGMAGLIRSLRPDLTNDEVLDVIRYTADDLGDPGHDPYYGNGIINVERALELIANNEDITFTNGQFDQNQGDQQENGDQDDAQLQDPTHTQDNWIDRLIRQLIQSFNTGQ